MNLLRIFVQHRRTTGVALGILYLVLLIAGWLLWPNAFFRGYWFGLMFWTQATVGAWVILLIQHLTGGEWGRVIAPYLRAASSGIFLLALLYIPAVFALPHIFPWTKIEPGISAPALVNKEPWLNSFAFTLRTIFYLVALAIMISQRSREALAGVAGPLLVFTIILFSFYSSDWMMSLQPTFYSSMYPFQYFADAMVLAFSVICAVAAWLQLTRRAPANPKLLLDYGTLLFSAVLFWGYILFAQFIIIWTGNLPNEAEWYAIRAEPTWLWLTVLLLLCHFAIPFCLLLSREIKKTPRKLLTLTGALFVLHFLEVFWMMRPTPGEGLRISPFDFLMPLLIGAGWLWFVLGARETALSISNLTAEAAHEA